MTLKHEKNIKARPTKARVKSRVRKLLTKSKTVRGIVRLAAGFPARGSAGASRANHTSPAVVRMNKAARTT